MTMPGFNLYQLPLPAGISRLELQKRLAQDPHADHGLRFEKFFGRWTDLSGNRHLLLKEVNSGRGKLSTDPVLDWLDPRYEVGKRPKGKQVELKCGNETLLQESAERREDLLRAMGCDSDDFRFSMQLATRLTTGLGQPHPSGNGFVFHPSLAVPFAPGSGIKQVAREVLEWLEPREIFGNDVPSGDEIGKIFGREPSGSDEGSAGDVDFLDGLPIEPIVLTAEITNPHYGPYYSGVDPARGARTGNAAGGGVEPADWYDPVPVTFLAVEAGAEFNFAVLPRRRKNEDSVRRTRVAAKLLKAGLSHCGFGARTTLDYGRFKDAPKTFKAGSTLTYLGPGGEEHVSLMETYTVGSGQSLIVDFGDGEREIVKPQEIKEIGG